MQVMNVAHPNSTKAGDNLHNLHTALDQYKVHVDKLQGMQWRYADKKIECEDIKEIINLPVVGQYVSSFLGTTSFCVQCMACQEQMVCNHTLKL